MIWATGPGCSVELSATLSAVTGSFPSLRYENSNLAPPVYELHIRLLGTTEAAVIREFHYVASLKERDGKNKDWHHVRESYHDPWENQG